jgi:ATP-dependent DNA helicase 2 subunit 2
LNIYAVPKKLTKARKDGHVHAQDEDDNLLLLDRKKAPEKSFIHVTEASSSSSKAKVNANAEDSETEDDDEDLLLNKKPSTPLSQAKEPLPTPARSLSPQVNPGRAPNRIIGTTYPLKDFQKNIAQGDVVTKAVEDLSAVITEIVMRPFASRRKSELLECMAVLRKTSLEVFQDSLIFGLNIFV